MIGFDPIGLSAIGELSSDGVDVIINATSFAVAVTKTAPVVTAGASASPAAKAVAVTAAIPKIMGGALVMPATIAVAVAANAAAVAISATVTVGAASAVTVTKSAPVVLGGASVAAGAAKAVTVTASAPVVTAGKSIFPAAANVTVTANAPGISISATIHPPVATVATSTTPASIVGGNYIDARNTITMNTPYGEVASASIGQFAIGEGEPSTRVVLQCPFVVVMASPPFIAAGKTILPTAANVNITSPRCEIDSRDRKLRILAIAS